MVKIQDTFCVFHMVTFYQFFNFMKLINAKVIHGKE